ncbi:MAG: hypothetical protein V1893_03695, partial [Candidatus Omnitrophota bacterium]
MDAGWHIKNRNQSAKERGLCFKTLTYLLVFITVFLGVPLPVPYYMPAPIKKSIEVVNKMTEIKDVLAATTGTTHIKRVYRGTQAFAIEEPLALVTIKDEAGTTCSVDTAKSIIILSAKNTAGGSRTNTENLPGERLFSAEFDQANTLLIKRGFCSEYGVPETVRWQVIEFDDGVTVTLGKSALAASNTSKEVTLPMSLTSGKSLILLNRTCSKYVKSSGATDNNDMNTNDECWEIKAKISSYGDVNNPAKVLFDRTIGKLYDTGADVTVDFTYQVVEFATDCSVQSGEATIVAGQTTSDGTGCTPATLTSGTNTTKSIFFFSSMASTAVNGVEANYMARGEYVAGTPPKITFTRTGTTGDVTIQWYSLEFTDNTSTQQGSISFTTETVKDSTTWTAVDERRSFSVESATTANTTINGIPLTPQLQYIPATTSPPSATKLTAERYVAGSNANACFVVATLPAVKVVTPNTADTVLKVGVPYAIQWRTGTFVTNVKIEYSDDNGTSWKTIIATTPASAKSYSWVVGKNSTDTADPGGSYSILPTLEKETDCLVRISSVSDSTLLDVSDAQFTIKSNLTLTAPNGGQLWFVNDTTRLITWNKWGNFDTTVKLQYSIDSGTNWSDISGATGLPVTDGSFTWNPVPGAAAGATVKARIISNTNSDILDASDSDFEVRPKITLTDPTDTDQWPVGRIRTIKWTQDGTIGNVDIHYSINSGVDWIALDGTNGNPNFQNYTPSYNAGGGYYYADWPISANTPKSPTCKIRVRRTSMPALVSDTCPDGGDEVFSIIASIDVTRPSAGTEIFKVGTSEPITWTIGGGSGVTNVRIKYSVDGGTFNTITGAENLPAAQGTFDWQVPDAISNNVKVRVEDTTDPNIVYDESNSAFKIKGRIVVTYPNSTSPDNILRVGGDYTIRWDMIGDIKNKNGNVAIALSKDDGESYSDPFEVGGIIAKDIDPSTESYLWTNIPNEIANTCRIKVYLPADPTPPDGVAGVSEQFAIKGSIANVFPDGGEIYYLGNVMPISWTPQPSNLAGTVRILWSIDSGSTYPYPSNLIAEKPASDGSYNWTLPSNVDILYDTVKIKVGLVGEENITFGQSENKFAVKGSLVLDRPVGGPVGGESWELGTTEEIGWTRNGATLGNINIYYSLNSGSQYLEIITERDSGNSPYLWSIPLNILNEKASELCNQVRVKIQSVNQSDIKDESLDFTIKSRFLSLSSNVNGNQTLYVGDNCNITWTTEGYGGGGDRLVDIVYSTDGGTSWLGTIVSNTPNIDAFQWGTVGGVADVVGNQVQVKVRSSTYKDEVYVKSQSNFTIDRKTLTITQPSDADIVLKVGEPYYIKWDKYGPVLNVDVLYSENNGSTYPYTIATSLPATSGQGEGYLWPGGVPDKIKGNFMKVKIVDCANSTATDVSNNPFEIIGKLSLSTPTGGNTWNVKIAGTIKWTPTGTWTNVDIYYTIDGGTNWTLAATCNAGTTGVEQTYSNLTPAVNEITDKFKVRVVDPNHTATVKAESSSNSRIIGSLLMTRPDDTDIVWNKGGTEDIKWTGTGNVDPVKIEYSTDGGTSWNFIAQRTGAQLANSGDSMQTYSWSPVADVKSETCRIKVTHDNPSYSADVNDTSNNNFAIRPELAVTQPMLNQDIIVGSTQSANIRITRTSSTITNAKLQYSTNGGSTYTDIQDAGNVALADPYKDYTWSPIPDAVLSQTVRIRAVDNGNSNVIGVSENCHLVGGLTLTSPITA